jgi:TatD DNase family protein
VIPSLIDSHCHLDPHNLAKGVPGPDEVIERARMAGVNGLVCVGVAADLGPARCAVDLAERRPDVMAVVGMHPHDASACTAEIADGLRQLASRSCVVAVGEIGLDYHYDFSPRPAQREVFRQFVALARELKKPIVVHSREAPDETIQILAEEGAREVGGVLHCFSEDVRMARKTLDLGFDISFSGIVTFSKAVELHEVARFVPADRYFVETDSPYLAPIPHRGRKCEPAYVVHTARRMAELRGTTLDQVARETTDNVVRRFRIDKWATLCRAGADP